MTDEQAGAQALQEEPGNPVASGADQGEPQVVCFGETMGMFTPTSTTSLDIEWPAASARAIWTCLATRIDGLMRILFKFPGNGGRWRR